MDVSIQENWGTQNRISTLSSKPNASLYLRVSSVAGVESLYSRNISELSPFCVVFRRLKRAALNWKLLSEAFRALVTANLMDF